MGKPTSILLDDDSEAFIGRQIAGGRYNNPDEVVAAGLRLLRDHDDEIEAIHAALIEGEESGIAEDFDFDAFLAMKREIRDRAMLSQSSIMRHLPVTMDLEARITCQILVTSADMVGLSMHRLYEILSGLRKGKLKALDAKCSTELCSLCWTIIDQIYVIWRITQKMEALPGTLLAIFREVS
eukprot:gene12967-17263_t